VPVEKVQKFMRHDDLETTMGYTWILDKEMNKMVAQADIHSFDVLAQPATQPVSEQVKVNPLELAQKRLACGEITLREYQKIARALAQII
jgi:hypothetical protein